MNEAALLRRLARLFQRTPLHQQWLLGRRMPPTGIGTATGRILDIGGADRWIEPLLGGAAEYIALDFPSTGGNMYGSRLCVFADAAQLPFRDNSFQIVLCLEVLEHVPRPATVMAEVSRALVPGGKAWISMPFFYPLHDAPFDFQRCTTFGPQRDAQAAGLEIVSLRKSSHSLRTAGLLSCLAIAGRVHNQVSQKRWPLLPAVLITIAIINVTAQIGSRLWPDWGNMTHGHELELRKP